MRKLTLVCLVLSMVAGTAFASSVTDYDVADSSYENNVLVSTGVAGSKAVADTVYLMGGGDGTGMFQNDTNPTLPDDEGWAGADLTAKTAEIWHIDTFNSPTGTNAMYCGEVFASCSAGDPAEGYGNSYEEYIDWVGTVADNGVATSVTVSFIVNYDNEPAYDFLYFQYEGAAGWQVQGTYNGSTYNTETSVWEPVTANMTFSVPASDLQGAGLNEVHLRFRGTSDGGWSDADCLWPTSGLAQVDNISVSGTNGLPSTTDDFESGLGGSNWQLAFPVAVGDFAKVWPQLQMLDPCNVNETPQVGFIDDGVVVPCTGGTLGDTWTYGPGSYTHNLTGGCAGPTLHNQSEWWSDTIAWEGWDDALSMMVPIGSTHAGAQYDFNVYPHLPIGNGMFYVWHVRSTDGIDDWSGWSDRNFVYYSNAFTLGWSTHDVTDLIVNTPTEVQLALGVNELGWVWGLEGTDGSPAPYFDNVIFRVYQIHGPAISTRELELAQDNFPTIGDIDYVNLDQNHIRFDMANDIMGDVTGTILPGDSITYNVTAVRPGSVLNDRPQLHYTLKPNSLFDAHRAAGPNQTVNGDGELVGWTYGDSIFTAAGALVPDRFGFDLPDEDFLFPGDVIHYYIYAEDNQGGNIGTTTLPGDLSGYGVFPGDTGYQLYDWPSTNIVRGLPTMFTAAEGDQPDILFYNDFGNRGGENEWLGALYNLGYYEGEDFDIYYVNAPSSGVSNGLGARATAPQIEHYSTMLYTFGNLSAYSLNTFNQSSDKSNDIVLLENWFGYNNRNFLATGDNLVFDLMENQGTAGQNFVSSYLAVNYIDQDISDLIGGQTAPLVLGLDTTANGGFDFSIDFYAYGSCPALNTFDAVEVTAATGVYALANWTLSGGAAYTGTEVAGVLYLKPEVTAKIVYFPVDLMYWYTVQGQVYGSGSLSARVQGLSDIMIFFGQLPGNTPVGVDTPMVLTAENYPNPFNPATEIKFNVPRDGRVAIKIFNVRGELVRTLVDDNFTAGTHVTEWNGTNDSGSSVASGVYFYETRAGGDVVVNKMALVK